MSRRERIALLERQSGRGGAAAGSPSSPALASSPSSAANIRAASEAPRVEAREDPVQQRPLGCRLRPQQPADQFPSDEELAHMSRRERIALLEGESSGGGTSSRAPAASARRREDSVPRRRGGNASLRAASTQSCPAENEADDQLDDEEWLERRRQGRKMRLQQKTAGRPPASLRSGAANTAAAAEDAGEAAIPPRPFGRVASTAGAPPGAEAAAENGNPKASGGSPLEDLEDIARFPPDDPRWTCACEGLAAGAHKLPPGTLARAAEVLAAAGAPPEGFAANGLRAAAEALLACLTPQLGVLGPAALADALRTMANGRVKEQTYLDMLLAQLLVLLRRDRSSFTPQMTSVLAGSLGALHDAGLSAKHASSGASSAANRRCVEALSEQIVGSLDAIGPEEVARLGGPFIMAFMDDGQRRAVLRRAAELQVGLRAETEPLLPALQAVEQSVRQHSFAFIASLPDETKDYLMRLKGTAAAGAAGTAARA